MQIHLDLQGMMPALIIVILMLYLIYKNKEKKE